jgi:hypothetical protein
LAQRQCWLAALAATVTLKTLLVIQLGGHQAQVIGPFNGGNTFPQELQTTTWNFAVMKTYQVAWVFV